MTPLPVGSIANADHKRVTYAVYLPEGVAYDDILKPEFWVHVADRLKINDRLEIYPADMSYYAELIVLVPGSTFAKVAPVLKTEIGSQRVEEIDSGYEIKLRGPRKWSAIRKSDSSVLFEDVDRREDAEIRLAEHLKEMAA